MAGDRRLIGGQGTVFANTGNSYALPVRNVTDAHRHAFVVGNALFNENWVATPASVKTRQGLGPLFNAQSCSTCHLKDGRGRPPENETERPVGLLFRLSVPGAQKTGAPLPVPAYGDQFNHRAIVGVKAEGDVRVAYDILIGAFPDGTPYSLQKPRIMFKALTYGPLPDSVLVSPRVAPAVFGLGLLQAIPEADLLAAADPDDRDGDGVSGRPNRVWDVAAGKTAVGRFGWKANQPHVRQQTFSAFQGDLGITSEHKSAQNCMPIQKDCARAPRIKGAEIDESSVTHVELYTRLLAVPARRDVDHPEVVRGEAVFKSIGCVACHRDSYTTGEDAQLPELSHQSIAPYTDLLLHDMGEGLADDRPDFEATGREWRTPPLWGLGLLETVNGHTRLLHDGRARNAEEAILWHGGEGEASTRRFKELPMSDRRALLRFLQSL